MSEYIDRNSEIRGPSLGRNLVFLFFVVLILVAGVWLFNRHHNETAGERIGSAIDAAPAVVGKGIGNATENENVREAGEKLKDAGATASSAISRTGAAASAAVSQTAEDIKAAAAKQKEQNTQASRSKSAGES